MTFSDFDAWKEEFNETLLADYGIDIEDAGLSDEELMKLADEPAYLAVQRYAEKLDLTPKTGVYF